MAQQTGQIERGTSIRQNRQEHPPAARPGIPWITVAKEAPYFVTEQGEDWTPIGQNDAITWPELQGVFRRRDLAPARAYFDMLARHGVTCLRLMLEYCHGEHRYFEKPAGRFPPHMVRLWDDIFALCESYGLRILLTPYDTFWMWIRWQRHPYKQTNGGPCNKRSEWLTSPEMRQAIKNRLAFATERWGGSGALFAWDLWNEIHPAHAGDSIGNFGEFIEDISTSLRQTELRLHGRAHPQTVSVFGPVLVNHPEATEPIFRHPALDFASVHFYESNTIDNPRNTVDAAISTGRLTREALAHTGAHRPFFDSEHGPIHSFKDHRKTLPEAFDDEYFRHMQWAHAASGGAGGGMRWPNRHPHSLTPGMRRNQEALARFLPLISWQQFKRRNLNKEIRVSDQRLAVFGCGDAEQAVVWLLRTDTIPKRGIIKQDAAPLPVSVQIPGLEQGRYQVTAWNTVTGTATHVFEAARFQQDDLLVELPPVAADMALAVRKTSAA